MHKRERRWFIERLDEEALSSGVVVARQPGGRGGFVPLEKLQGFRTATYSGGMMRWHHFPHIYAYGTCTELPVAHSGVHGPCPHSIKVCVESAERDDVWDALCEFTDHEPATEEDYQREREHLRAEIVERMGGEAAALPSCKPESEVTGAQPPFEGHEDFFVEDCRNWLFALARRTQPYWYDMTCYFDRKTGGIILFDPNADIDEREHLHDEGRYVEIEPLSEKELDLLTRSDLEEIGESLQRSMRRQASG